MPTNTFIRCAAKAALLALPVSCMVAMESCRTTSKTCNRAAETIATDSIAINSITDKHIDHAENMNLKIEEWQYYPADSTGNADKGSLMSHRQISATRNRQTEITDTGSSNVLQTSATTVDKSAKASATSTPVSHDWTKWVIIASTALLAIFLIFNPKRSSHRKNLF